jgi:hypothetical protein
MRFFPIRLLLAALTIALLTVTADAQGMFGGGGKRNHGQRSEQNQPKKPKADEPVQTPVQDNKPAGAFDPWHSVRSGNAAAAAKNPI